MASTDFRKMENRAPEILNIFTQTD
jgi:hypothetical protein